MNAGRPVCSPGARSEVVLNLIQGILRHYLIEGQMQQKSNGTPPFSIKALETTINIT